jgi:hypothetical protein
MKTSDGESVRLSQSEFKAAVRAVARAAADGEDERTCFRAGLRAVERLKNPGTKYRTGGFK